MKLVVIPNHEKRILPYYLAVEEWVAQVMPDDDYFFAWQVSPTVICGRHQQMALEVDLNFCNEAGIEIWRRKSGGGCVYADKNNIMFSYITPSTGVETTFESYTSMVCRMLQSLNIHASATGRNDIEINGMKVSGNAFYALPGRSIVHGTMLYDADFETMGKALTPSRAKLTSKGVRSVPSRVTTLKNNGITLSCDEFINYTIDYMCSEKIIIDEKAEAEIEEIMKSYLSPKFLNDRSSQHSLSNNQRIESVGELIFSYELDDYKRISNPQITGDFFLLAPVDEVLSKISGSKLDRDELEMRLHQFNIPQLIMNLTNEQFINLILDSNP